VIGLTFDEIAHRYELDGVTVPSVTGVLKAAGLIDFSGIPADTLEAARRRGTAVHQAICYYNENDLNVEQFAIDYPDFAGYLLAWINFCAMRSFVPVLNERRVASRLHQIAGTLDCLGTLDGAGALIDFATGSAADACKQLQTAAYLGLAHEWADDDPAIGLFLDAHPIIRRYAVELKADGRFNLQPYTAPSDFREFLALRAAQAVVDKHRRRAVAA